MRRLLFSMVVLFGLLPFVYGGCGGGGGGSSVTPPSNSLIGTYRLDDGQIDLVDYNDSAYISEIYSSYSGELNISSGSIHSSATFDGQPHNSTASYTTHYTYQTSEGYFVTSLNSNTAPPSNDLIPVSELFFQCSGNKLYLWRHFSSYSYGNASLYLYYTKISDAP